MADAAGRRRSGPPPDVRERHAFSPIINKAAIDHSESESSLAAATLPSSDEQKTRLARSEERDERADDHKALAGAGSPANRHAFTNDVPSTVTPPATRLFGDPKGMTAFVPVAGNNEIVAPVAVPASVAHASNPPPFDFNAVEKELLDLERRQLAAGVKLPPLDMSSETQEAAASQTAPLQVVQARRKSVHSSQVQPQAAVEAAASAHPGAGSGAAEALRMRRRSIPDDAEWSTRRKSVADAVESSHTSAVAAAAASASAGAIPPTAALPKVIAAAAVMSPPPAGASASSRRAHEEDPLSSGMSSEKAALRLAEENALLKARLAEREQQWQQRSKDTRQAVAQLREAQMKVEALERAREADALRIALLEEQLRKLEESGLISKSGTDLTRRGSGRSSDEPKEDAKDAKEAKRERRDREKEKDGSSTGRAQRRRDKERDRERGDRDRERDRLSNRSPHSRGADGRSRGSREELASMESEESDSGRSGLTSPTLASQRANSVENKKGLRDGHATPVFLDGTSARSSRKSRKENGSGKSTSESIRLRGEAEVAALGEAGRRGVVLHSDMSSEQHSSSEPAAHPQRKKKEMMRSQACEIL